MNPDGVTIWIELILFLLKPQEIELYLFTWIRIKFQFIPDGVHSIFHSGPNTRSGFHSGINSTFIMVEIRIFSKMGSFIHILKCRSAKIAENWIRWSVQIIWNEFQSGTEIFICRDLTILNSISHVNTDWILSVVRDWKLIRIHHSCKLPLTIVCHCFQYFTTIRSIVAIYT